MVFPAGSELYIGNLVVGCNFTLVILGGTKQSKMTFVVFVFLLCFSRARAHVRAFQNFFS